MPLSIFSAKEPMYIPQALAFFPIDDASAIPEPIVSISPFLWVTIAIGPLLECSEIQSLNARISKDISIHHSFERLRCFIICRNNLRFPRIKRL